MWLLHICNMNPSVQNTIFSLGFLLYWCYLLRLRISAFLMIISVWQILSYSYYFLRRHVRACNQGCMQPVTWLVARVMWLVAGVTWQVAGVTRQVARVTWQVARVTWQVAEVACNQSCDWLQGLHATCHVTGCTRQITSVRHKLSLDPFLDDCWRCLLNSKSC